MVVLLRERKMFFVLFRVKFQPKWVENLECKKEKFQFHFFLKIQLIKSVEWGKISGRCWWEFYGFFPLINWSNWLCHRYFCLLWTLISRFLTFLWTPPLWLDTHCLNFSCFTWPQKLRLILNIILLYIFCLNPGILPNKIVRLMMKSFAAVNFYWTVFYWSLT